MPEPDWVKNIDRLLIELDKDIEGYREHVKNGRLPDIPLDELPELPLDFDTTTRGIEPFSEIEEDFNGL